MIKKKKINRIVKFIRIDKYKKSKAKRPSFTVDWTFSCNKNLNLDRNRELIPLHFSENQFCGDNISDYYNGNKVDRYFTRNCGSLEKGNYYIKAKKSSYDYDSDKDYLEENLAQNAAQFYLC